MPALPKLQRPGNCYRWQIPGSPIQLFLLDRLQVCRQVVYPHLLLRRVMLAHGEEYGTPHRHFLVAMRGREVVALNDGRDMRIREFSAVLHRENCQVGWLRLQSRSRGAVSPTVLPMTRRTVRDVHVFAGGRAGVGRRTFLIWDLAGCEVPVGFALELVCAGSEIESASNKPIARHTIREHITTCFPLV